MKTKILFIAGFLTLCSRAFACVDLGSDYYYSNVFSQALIKDARYASFLLAYDTRFYANENKGWTAPNANVEEWQQYLGISYDQAHYLVMKASRADVLKMTKGDRPADEKLGFITAAFMQRHKQALLYIAYAKYLEPFMRIQKDGEWRYGFDDRGDKKEATELDYDKTVTVLTRSWLAESDKELKLRYGYQLVRLAHYQRKYTDAILFFDKYVEPLNYKTEMYYYALSQKAGALFGLARNNEALSDFIRVFSYSKDLKTSAYTSLLIQFGAENMGLDRLLSSTPNAAERRSLLFLIAYNDFNNPLRSIDKITADAPDAIEAKILMTRAINHIERKLLAHTYGYSLNVTDRRYPLTSDDLTIKMLDASYLIAQKITKSAKEKSFWHLATAYLAFLKRDFVQARKSLDLVGNSDKTYAAQKNIIEDHLYVASQPMITPDIEKTIFTHHRKWLKYDYEQNNRSFVNILANRYYLQQDYAKAFLLTNKIEDVRYNLHKNMIDFLADFYQKKNKNQLEQWLSQKLGDNPRREISLLYGTLALNEGNFEEAVKHFAASGRRIEVSNRIFGYNIGVRYSVDESKWIYDDYIAEFDFIKPKLSEKELSEILVRLRQLGNGKGDRAAKANFLIANFYYNVTSTGYYRHYLRFDKNNEHDSKKYGEYNVAPSIYDYTDWRKNQGKEFFVDYTAYPYYRNTDDISDQYFKKAFDQSTDNELKAKILFGMAKCAQQRYYRSNSRVNPSHQVFDQLTHYRNTNFYNRLSNECSYFLSYSAR